MIGPVGVCSWSLRASGPSDLVASVRACGLGRVQLALEPIRSRSWSLDETVESLAGAAIEVMSGMFEPALEDYSSLESIRRTGGLRPDETWEENLARAEACAEIASAIELELVTFHAGFIPHDQQDAERAALIDRVRRIADIFAGRGVRIALETGQETAETLAAMMPTLERESIGINFDPANMILYGMGDPVTAVETLAPWIVQAHLKDAMPTIEPGEWGSEVPVGSGAVDWESFGRHLRSLPAIVPVVFEREAGDQRVPDICQGIAALSMLDPYREAFHG
ncbi:MAG: sugar phosphate isomerase/epimerase family protein [Phycisphaerales bacterium]